MPSFPIVKIDPPADDFICLLDIFEVVMPDAFFFDRSEKPFDHAILLRRIGCDELLLESVGLGGLGKCQATNKNAPKRRVKMYHFDTSLS